MRFAVEHLDLDGYELLVDLFARIDDLIDEVARRVTSTGSGKVGSGRAACVLKAMTGVASGAGEHGPAVFEIATGHTGFGVGC